MLSTTLTVFGVAALATAQSSTVSLFLPMADPQSLDASIVGSDSTATTYVVSCANSAAASAFRAEITAAEAAVTEGAAAVTSLGNFNTAESACGFPDPITVTEGPSTVHYTIEYLGIPVSLGCSLGGTTEAACTISSSGAGSLASAAETGGALPTGLMISGDLITSTFTGDDAQSGYLPVVVKGGSATAKATTATTTGAAAGAGGKGGSTMTTGSTTKETSTGTSKATSTGTSTGSAAAKATGGAGNVAPVFGAGILGAFGVAVAGALL